MQISTGLVSVANGSQTVSGNDSVDWTQVTVGSLIILSGAIYRIAEVDALAKEITIVEPFAGTTLVDVAYVIARDFTPNLGLPLINPGDLEAAALVSRSLQILDQALTLGTGDASLGEFLVAKAAHGFLVGNFLTLSGGTWTLGLSDTIPHSTLVGCVKEVVDADHFKIVTQGKISDIDGLTLTPGNVYFLRDTSSPVTGGFVNITDDLLETDIYVPVLQADSPTSGFILNLARANAGRFSQDNDGIVPGPTAGEVAAQAVLCADGVWRVLSVGTNSIQAKHLYSGALNWAGFDAQSDGVSVHAVIQDLHSSITALQAYSRRTAVTFAKRNAVNPGTGIGSLTIPARVGSVLLRIYSGSSVPFQVGFRKLNILGKTEVPVYNVNGLAVEFAVDVVEGQTLSWNVGQAVGYIDDLGGYPSTTQGRIRFYLNGDLVIDLNPWGQAYGSVVSPLTFDATKARFLSYIPWDLNSVAGIYRFETIQVASQYYALKMENGDPAPQFTPFAVSSVDGVIYVQSIVYPFVFLRQIAGCAVLTYQQ